MKNLAAGLLFITGMTLLFFASHAHAAPCPTGTATCAAYSTCVSYEAPTTREAVNGVSVPLPLSELSAIELSLDGKVVQSSMALSYVYPTPANQTLTTASIWSAVAIDTKGARSKPVSCSQPKAVSGPQSPPSAPGGLTVTTN